MPVFRRKSKSNAMPKEVSNIVMGSRVSPVRFGKIGKIAAACFSTALLGACSTSFPLPSFSKIATNDVTGSIKPISPLSSKLDGEDWRRAKGALAVALDPQSNGAPVSWDNPESKISGSFVPVGQAWTKDNNICRTFIARLAGSHPKRQLQGNACRDKSGEWAIGEVQPWTKL